jgi:hypothetical protein
MLATGDQGGLTERLPPSRGIGRSFVQLPQQPGARRTERFGVSDHEMRFIIDTRWTVFTPSD